MNIVKVLKIFVREKKCGESGTTHYNQKEELHRCNYEASEMRLVNL